VLGPPPPYTELIDASTVGDPFLPDVFVFDKNFEIPETDAYSVSVEREVRPDVSVLYKYNYAKTKNLTRFVNRNDPALGSPWGSGLEPGGANGINTLTVVESSARSEYTGHTVGLTKRGGNVQAQVFYTYSEDKSDDDNERDPFTFRYADVTNLDAEFGLSDRDQKNRFNAWLQHHRLSAADSLLRVLNNPGSSLLTWLVIGIALALPMGLSIALDNISEVSTSWESPAQISLFLQDGLAPEQASELATELPAREDVGATQLITREEALDEFRTLSGFSDVLASLQENPLPDLILVTPAPGLDESQIALLRDELDATPEVAEAVLDMAWLQRLNSLMELGRRLVLAVGGMLVIGVLLILGNTIRLAIENRREEIVVIKLVGGSNGFVRRPFLYTGLWYGVGGGVLAAVLVSAALWFLEEPIGELVLLYESAFRLSGLGVMGALNLVILGGLLGLAGAWLAVSRHLVHIEPR